MLGLMAKKIGMTQIFDQDGNAQVVTVLQLMENIVTKKLNKKDNGYNAVQIGYEIATEKKLTKAQIGNLKKQNLPLLRRLKEFRVSEEIVNNCEVGQELNPVQVLGEEGSLVDVTGRPIGKGTSGRIVRWNQSRRTMTHGTKHHRQIGSCGPGTTPGRVFKGLHMPGRDNNDVTIPHLKFIKFVPEQNVVLLQGAVPGFDGAIVSIKSSKKKGEWNKTALLLNKRKAA